MKRGADRLVLGTLGVGSRPEQIAGYAPISDEVAFAVMDAAWALGIRVAETALSYGSGAALRRLAAWQAKRGYGFSVVAKLGRPVVNGAIRPNYAPDALRREFDAYLAHGLNVTVALVKDPPKEDIRSGRWEARLDALAAAHPCIGIGFASHALDACRAAPLSARPAIVSIEINAANWIAAAPALDHLASVGFQVWAMQPLAGGFMTAAAQMRKGLHPADWRNVYPDEILKRKRALGARAVEALRAATPDVNIAAAAHAFLLSEPRVERLVIGPRLVRHLEDIANALDLVAGDTGASA